jgi:hypothetical protein
MLEIKPPKYPMNPALEVYGLSLFTSSFKTVFGTLKSLLLSRDDSHCPLPLLLLFF